MKLGIKKLHENEWQVHMGNAIVRMDRFSVELLNITLDHLIALQSGQTHSVLASYIKIAEKMLKLNGPGLQTLVQSVDNQDLLKLLLVAQNQELNQLVVTNVGGIMAKQLNADLTTSPAPSSDEAKEAIRKVIEKMFALEADGRIEFFDENQRYI